MTPIRFDELIAARAPRPSARVQYGSGALRFGDLWLPTGGGRWDEKRTTIVFIHGGCWMSAYTLDHATYAASALAAAGYVVWLPEYRRIGDIGGGWPGTFDDIDDAVNFVRVLATDQPQVDANRVILAGHSAGGHLALWAATRRRDSSRAIGVVALAGISDLASYAAQPGSCNASVPLLLDGGPTDVPDRYRATSPIERLPIGVPMHLVHGARDPIVPVAMSTAFAAHARAAGDHVNVTTIDSAGHFDLIAPQTGAWPSVIAAFQGISPPR
jgi:acetyl esterase/lipase